MKKHCRRFVIVVESMTPVIIPARPENQLKSAITDAGFRVIDMHPERSPKESTAAPRRVQDELKRRQDEAREVRR